MNDVTYAEPAFRQGYLQGARSVLEALGHRLPEEQQRTLSRWVEGPLAAWSRSDDEATAPVAPLLDGA